MATVTERLVYNINEPSDNAHVVMGATRMLARMGFDRTKQYLIASAVSELSTNIIRYAHGGTVVMEDITYMDKRVFVVTARDRGPGIEDIGQALTEHYSTGKGLGLGLPSVKRIMDEFEIRSRPGQGTRVTARKWVRESC